MSDAFRKRMGRRVREVWVRWAEKQPNPKPSWLLNYDAITPAEQDADDCIGMAIWAECFDKFQSEIAELELTKQRLAAAEAAMKAVASLPGENWLTGQLALAEFLDGKGGKHLQYALVMYRAAKGGRDE